jgi:hypothetical protein
MLLLASVSEPQGSTPAERLYGRNIQLPFDFGLPQELVSAIDGDAVRKDLDSIALDRRNAAALASKQRYDATRDLTEFNVGDLVLRRNHRRVGKHSPRFLGPFEIAQKLSPLVYKLTGIPGGRSIGRMHNVVNIADLERFKGSKDDVREQRGDGPEQVVEAIVGDLIDDDEELWFNVRWHGGDETTVQWYNLIDIDDANVTTTEALELYLNQPRKRALRQRVTDLVAGVRAAKRKDGEEDADDG